MPYPLLILAQIAWAAGLAVGSLGLGGWLLRRIGGARPGSAGDAALALGLGLAMFSYAVFALAAAHALSRPVLAAASALWALAGGALAWRARGGGSAPRLSGFSLACLAILGALAVCNLPPALTPAVDWDGLAYHLALPKLYLQAGGFVFRPDIFHNLFPQFTEMLFLPGLIFPYGTAPKLVHLGFGLLAAAAVWALGRERRVPEAGALGALFFYAQYLVHLESGTAFVDLAAAAYLALAMIPVARFLDDPGRTRELALAVLLAGLAGAVKWQGLVLAALAAAVAAATVWLEPGRPWGRKLAWTAGFAGLALLPVAPYAVRNLIESGNPVWPLAYSWFGGRGWDAAIAERVVALHTGFGGVTKNWIGLARLPWDLFAHGARFGHGGAELRWPLAGGSVLLGAAIWARRSAGPRPAAAPAARRVAAGLGLALAAYLVIWFKALPQETRYLLPLFPALAWVLARAALAAWRSPRRGLKVMAVIGALLMLAVHPPVHRQTPQELKVLAGRLAPDAFLEDRLETYSAGRYLDARVAAGERVLVFGDNQAFYLDAPYLWGDPVLQNVVDYRRLADPRALRARLDQLGVAWVLRREGLFGPAYQPPEIAALLDAALALGSRREYEAGQVAVYRLEPPRRP